MMTQSTEHRRQFVASSRFAAALGLLSLLAGGNAATAAAKHALREPVTQTRPYLVKNELEVTGTLETSLGGGKSRKLDLKVDAKLNFIERRLSSGGQGPLSLRSIRQYQTARADIDVSGQATSSMLRENRRRIVALGRRDGIVVYSPTGPLTYQELELMRMPGDSLAVQALLPLEEVEVGASWEPASWVMQVLTDTEAVLESKLSCTLKSANGSQARVEFNGKIEGATVGSSTNIDLSGHYIYDQKQQCITRLEIIQKEKRSVGTVTPGLDVTATVSMTRAPASDNGGLTDEVVADVPFDPSPNVMLLRFQTPWNARFVHGRTWHVFHQSSQVCVLRLVENGSLVAQCNLTRLKQAAPGEHTPIEQFEQDIREALGEKLKEVVSSEKLKTEDDRHVFRLVCKGESNKIPVQWHYYLCAAPTGDQVAFVFSVSPDLVKKLAGRDEDMAKSIEFFTPDVTPAAATEEKPAKASGK